MKLLQKKISTNEKINGRLFLYYNKAKVFVNSL